MPPAPPVPPARPASRWARRIGIAAAALSVFLCVRALMQASDRSAAEDAFAPFGKQILPGDLSPLPSPLRPLPDIGGMEVINTGRELLGGIEVDATNVYMRSLARADHPLPSASP